MQVCRLALWRFGNSTGNMAFLQQYAHLLCERETRRHYSEILGKAIGTLIVKSVLRV